MHAILNLHEYEAAARACLGAGAWDYFQGGSEDELTLAENRAAFGRMKLRPRVLVDVTACDTSTRVLDVPVASPILVAPMGFQRLAHADGELATTRAASGAGTVMVASTMASVRLEDLAAVPGSTLWFQLYLFRDRAITMDLVRRAEAAGCRALVITVDAPRLGRRERDLRRGFALPDDLRAANLPPSSAGRLHEAGASGSAIARHAQSNFDAGATWETVAWIRSISTLPVVVKGILTAEDAKLARASGVAAIVVSNHGGRQLDGVLAAIEALPEVVEAVAGGCEVYLDGGVRRGTDVLKALALGARAVLVGRPLLWGLAVDGEAGVRRVLELLRDELALAMALSGRPQVARVDRSLVKFP
ncbi:alpha-hydroxy acid oxidase [Pendulispora albinea]|uniref:Alpha-hydroxy-acid oxidizing protein n=1 Tax=Pendulispora albinea TaxID=2741071 RepID=A0ABZ2MB72_9BACT